eukprot:62626-Rhodomonas_salina.3
MAARLPLRHRHRRGPTHLLPGPALPTPSPVLIYRIVLSAYAIAMRCPVLSYRMVLSTYWSAEQRAVLTYCIDLLAYVPTRLRQGWTLRCVSPYARAMQCPVSYAAISLCTRYAISSTELAYAAISLCTHYVISGTDLQYVAMTLRARYAMSGTDLEYNFAPGPAAARGAA